MYAMLFLRSWEEHKNFNVLFAPSTNYFLHFYCVLFSLVDLRANNCLSGKFSGKVMKVFCE